MKRLLLLTVLLITSFYLSLAQIDVSGTVTDDADGTPLPGVTVQVKGTQTVTTTNAEGRFSVSAAGDAVLVFTHIGRISREVNVNNQGTINISLMAGAGALQEVVVVAYGQQQSRKITGAVGKVKGSEVENIPLTSVDQILQGKVAGLQSVAPSGQPGSFQQIRIRGIGSINSSSAPLYVIDGIPVNIGDFSDATNSSNLLAGLNANDIESISVLKDAASASIYGSRAANGVIIITTKKGRPGKTKIRVDAEFGTNDIAYFPSLATPLTKNEVKELITEGVFNIGQNQQYLDFVLNVLGFNGTADYNWLDLVKRKGQQQQINVSASGGDTRTQYFISGGYFSQQSMIIGSDFKRYSGTMNLKHQASERLTFGSNISISSFKQTGEVESANFRNPVIAAKGLLPTAEAYNPDGSPNYDPAVFNQIYNPLAIRKYDRLGNQTSKLLGSAFAELKILPNLKLSSRFGIDYNNIEESLYYNPFFGDAATNDPATTGVFYNSYNRLYNWVWTNLAEYSFKTWSDKINGSILAGYEAQKSKLLTQDATGQGLPLTSSVVYPSPVTPQPAIYAGSDYSVVSLLSKGEISFLDRYTVSGSLRRDGSSRFGENNRYGVFWSVGAAWNIDREKFMENIPVISLLKLRASYGVNGNAGIGNYNWRSTYSFTGTYNGLPASFPDNVGNPDLTWEQNKPLDIGIEVAVLNNRINIEADYYNRKTDQLLLNEPLSLTSGFGSFDNNVGAMVNKGIEITLSAVPVKTKDLNWTISLNASWNKNEVTKLRDGQNEIRSLPYIIRVGEDVQSIFTRLWAGADPQTGNPLWYVDDTKGQTTSDFSKANRAIIGSASPKGLGGISTSFTYKYFTVEAQLNYQYGNYVNDQWGFLLEGDGAYPTVNSYRKQLRRWQKPGDITDIPRYDFFNSTTSNAGSSRYFYKGDYLRLRNLSFAFDMPKVVTDKMRISKLTLYVRGTNLWTKTFDKNITIDPEEQINGTSDLQFFIPKSITAGINIQL